MKITKVSVLLLFIIMAQMCGSHRIFGGLKNRHKISIKIHSGLRDGYGVGHGVLGEILGHSKALYGSRHISEVFHRKGRSRHGVGFDSPGLGFYG
jgi:hypothetical protein